VSQQAALQTALRCPEWAAFEATGGASIVRADSATYQQTHNAANKIADSPTVKTANVAAQPVSVVPTVEAAHFAAFGATEWTAKHDAYDAAHNATESPTLRSPQQETDWKTLQPAECWPHRFSHFCSFTTTKFAALGGTDSDTNHINTPPQRPSIGATHRQS